MEQNIISVRTWQKIKLVLGSSKVCVTLAYLIRSACFGATWVRDNGEGDAGNHSNVGGPVQGVPKSNTFFYGGIN